MEKFVKTMLRAYKVEASGNVKAVLLCRARLFYRCGRALAGPVPVEASRVLADLEAKFAHELLQCGALSKKPEPQYKASVLVRTVVEDPLPAKASSKASSSKSKARGPEVLDLEEESLEELAPPSPDVVVNADEVPDKGMHRFASAPWSVHTESLWQRLGAMALLQLHIRNRASCDGVEVVRLDASEPVVWQARALCKFKTDDLMLVPWTEASLLRFAEGSKVSRPKGLYPCLPFMATIVAGAPSLDDTATFLMKSPLGKMASSAEDSAPAPFWATCFAQDPSHANMIETRFVLNMAQPKFDGFGLSARAQNTARLANLEVSVSGLVNTRVIEKGEVLVSRAAASSDAADAGAAADEDAAPEA